MSDLALFLPLVLDELGAVLFWVACGVGLVLLLSGLIAFVRGGR